MWFNHKIDGELAQTIRRDLRLYRREKGRGGHKFLFKDLLSIYSTEGDNPAHVIVTHHDDSAWQHYWRHPERGWMQQKTYDTEDEAKQAVETFERPKDNFRTPVRKPDGSSVTETYLTFKPKGSRQLKVKVSTPWVEEQMAGIFARLGFDTNRTTKAS